MKLLLAVSSIVLALATSSFAYDTVVCFADSIGNEPGPTTNYCAQLQQLRPDLVVKNRSAGGRDTVLALSQVSAIVDEACAASDCLVLIHHGQNDLFLPDPDARQTAKRLRSIWARARGGARDAWILTLLPSIGVNHAFTRDVGNSVYALMRRSTDVFDARDVFSHVGWDGYTYDGVHPNAAGAALIAAALADAIP